MSALSQKTRCTFFSIMMVGIILRQYRNYCPGNNSVVRKIQISFYVTGLFKDLLKHMDVRMAKDKRE